MLISRQPPTRPPSGGGTVSSEYLRMVAFAAEMRGLTPAKIYKSAGIDTAVLRQRGARLPIAPMARVWTQITEGLRDPLFGLDLVNNAPFGSADILDYVLRNCATVGETMRLLGRFSALMNDSDVVRLTISGREARVRLRTAGDVPTTCEMLASFFARRSRDSLGASWALNSVSFTHAPLGPRVAYDRALQAQVHFGMPFNEIVFNRDLLDLPTPGADARLKNIMMAQAEELLATLAPPPSPSSFVELVEQAVATGLAEGDARLSRLADQLHLNTRTVQRRLRDAGLTHRDVVRRLRLDLASRSLVRPEPSQRQIARALGYSGPGAFHRAFKRWSGMTPGQVRLRGDAPGGRGKKPR